MRVYRTIQHDDTQGIILGGWGRLASSNRVEAVRVVGLKAADQFKKLFFFVGRQKRRSVQIGHKSHVQKLLAARKASGAHRGFRGGGLRGVNEFGIVEQVALDVLLLAESMADFCRFGFGKNRWSVLRYAFQT